MGSRVHMRQTTIRGLGGLTLGVILAALLFVTLGQGGGERSAITPLRGGTVAEVKQIFQGMGTLLPEGDAFDFDNVFFFTGHFGDIEETTAVVPLTPSSPSYGRYAQEDFSWKEVDSVTLGGLYIGSRFSPRLAPGVYVLKLVSWDEVVAIDSSGQIAGKLNASVELGKEPEFWATYRGSLVNDTSNSLFHDPFSTKWSTDQ